MMPPETKPSRQFNASAKRILRELHAPVIGTEFLAVVDRKSSFNSIGLRPGSLAERCLGKVISRSEQFRTLRYEELKAHRCSWEDTNPRSLRLHEVHDPGETWCQNSKHESFLTKAAFFHIEGQGLARRVVDSIAMGPDEPFVAGEPLVFVREFHWIRKNTPPTADRKRPARKLHDLVGSMRGCVRTEETATLVSLEPLARDSRQWCRYQSFWSPVLGSSDARPSRLNAPALRITGILWERRRSHWERSWGSPVWKCVGEEIEEPATHGTSSWPLSDFKVSRLFHT